MTSPIHRRKNAVATSGDLYACKRSRSKVSRFNQKIEWNGRTSGRTEAILLPPVVTRSIVNLSCNIFFAPGRGAKYCGEYVCLSIRSHNSKTARRNFTKLCMLPVALVRSFSDGVAIRYVLPVLWMTSCFHTTGPIDGIKHDLVFRRSSLGGGASWTSDNCSDCSSS